MTQQTLAEATTEPENTGTDASIESPSKTSPEAGDTVISFTVSGDWGHFRKIDGNLIKQTYKIPPRTTIAGMVAGIMGLDRDSYYTQFALENAAISVEPEFDLRTINIPVNSISSKPKHMDKASGENGDFTFHYPDSTANRQQFNYEVLVDPEYRIHLWFANDEFQQQVFDQLESGESVYTPTLGLSEYLANITNVTQTELGGVEHGGGVPVSSAVPGGYQTVTPAMDAVYHTERSPAEMTANSKGRKTTEYTDYVYSTSEITVEPDSETDVVTVGGRHVMFQ